jgi:tRNA A-37 threonylcarbamoyl transferase component Bud32
MTSIRTCPRCGAPLAPNLDQSQPCPRCLLQAALRVSSASSSAERVPAPAVSELQQHFPQLEILELIGEGGMGAVYKARDKKLDRLIALKILTIAGEDGAFDERFAREARAMAQLSHPNIAAVHEHGKAGPWSYLFLEYIEGENLRRRMRCGTVSPKEALSWVGQICDALQYAHEHGVVHRDIKPENVLIDAHGRVKVVDFGLAKLLNRKPGDATLTSAQQALGTWHYMAPEQYERPQEVDHRADIYSLGVVFYELLTGQVPVGRFDLPSQRIQLDVRLDDVVLKALAREPDKRYQHASDVKNDCEHLDHMPAREAPRPSHATGWIAAILVGAAVLFLSVGAVALAFVFLGGASSPEQVTRSQLADGGTVTHYGGNTGRELLLYYGPWILIVGAALAITAVALHRHSRRKNKGPAMPHLDSRPKPLEVPTRQGTGLLAVLLIAAGGVVLVIGAFGVVAVLLATLSVGHIEPGPASAIAVEPQSSQFDTVLTLAPWLLVLGAGALIGGFALRRHLRRNKSAAPVQHRGSAFAWRIAIFVLLFLFCGCGGFLLWNVSTVREAPPPSSTTKF